MISQPHPTQIWVDHGGPATSGAGRQAGSPRPRPSTPRRRSSSSSSPPRSRSPSSTSRFAPSGSTGTWSSSRSPTTSSEEGDSVRSAFEAGRLEEVYSDLTLDDEAVKRGLDGGLAGRGHRLSRLPARPAQSCSMEVEHRLPAHARGQRNGAARSSPSSRPTRCTRSAATSRPTPTSFRRGTMREPSAAPPSASSSDACNGCASASGISASAGAGSNRAAGGAFVPGCRAPSPG